MNVKTCNIIYPERGIWQGDLIFPYIFIIGAKYLGCFIHFSFTQPKLDISIQLKKIALIPLFDVCQLL